MKEKKSCLSTVCLINVTIYSNIMSMNPKEQLNTVLAFTTGTCPMKPIKILKCLDGQRFRIGTLVAMMGIVFNILNFEFYWYNCNENLMLHGIEFHCK